MIVCNACGHHNESDDTFCGSCGAFLEWENEAEAAKAPAATVAVTAEAEGEPAPAPAVDDEADRARAAAVAEKHERAQREAAEAEQQRKDAEARAKAEEAAAQAARDQAQAAEAARRRAEDEAKQEAEAAAQLRARLEGAEASRKQAQEQLEREMAALEEERGSEAEKVRSELEAKLAAERAEVENARRRAEEAEKERVVADARAEAEAKAAQEAARKVEEAEKARLAAEEQAKQEQEAAERAKRAAALVARPPQTVTKPAKKATAAKPPADAADAAETEDPDAAPPGPQAPAAVKPARSKVRQGPKKKTAPSRTIRPGDLVCGECGEGNTPERKFCRRCGTTLEDAEPAAKPPWWRRLRRTPKTYAAGERRGRGPGAKGKKRGARRGMRRVKAMLGFLVLLLGGLGIAVAPIRNQVTGWIGDRVDDVRGTVAPDYEPIRPVAAEASSAAADHPPEYAIDLTSNRWWATTGGDDGIGERIEIDFGEPANIRVVGVLPGAADAAEYAAQPRPRELRLIFDNGATATLELTDEHEFQTFDVRGADDTTGVIVEVLSVYRGQSGSEMAITSLEFQVAGSP